MLDINCTINDCIFEVEGKCTLTHASTPSSYLNNECIYFRPNDSSTYTNLDTSIKKEK